VSIILRCPATAIALELIDPSEVEIALLIGFAMLTPTNNIIVPKTKLFFHAFFLILYLQIYNNRYLLINIYIEFNPIGSGEDRIKKCEKTKKEYKSRIYSYAQHSPRPESAWHGI
jgi:hypothetical protein